MSLVDFVIRASSLYGLKTQCKFNVMDQNLCLCLNEYRSLKISIRNISVMRHLFRQHFRFRNIALFHISTQFGHLKKRGKKSKIIFHIRDKPNVSLSSLILPDLFLILEHISQIPFSLPLIELPSLA